MVICDSVNSPSTKKAFLLAMRGITSTVTIISAKKDSYQQAMTATSVASLSLEPPSMLVCVNHEASIHNIMEKEKDFCINVLKANQVQVADVCSKKEYEYERFLTGNWSLLDNIPYIIDAQSNLFCRCIDLIKHETHTIYLGEVTKVTNKDIANPLLYKDGKYLD